MYKHSKNSLLSVLFWYLVLKLLIPKERAARWPGSSAGRGQCDVSLSKTGNSHSTSSHTSGITVFNVGLGGGGGGYSCEGSASAED